MRFLPLSILFLAIFLSFSACHPVTTIPPVSEQSGAAPVSESSALKPSVPANESNRIPDKMQITSITPALQSQILEKRKENSDAMGWLIVPGTTINDVVLLNPPGNNDYYTTHNFSRQSDKNGAYGLDYSFHLSGAERDTLFRNTILYAHNHDDNPDGILFAQLKKYKDPDFAKGHPYIFFSTAEDDMVWEIFAVFDATIDFRYIEPGIHWDVFRNLLETIYDASIYNYGVTVSESDKLLTLSTCTFSVDGHESMPVTMQNKYRFVIMARLVAPEEQIKNEAVFTINDAPLAPDDIPSMPCLMKDAFILNGTEYVNADSWILFHDNDCLETIEWDNFIPIGKIERSSLGEPVKDWQATQLSEGTTIYQNADYMNVLAADIDGKMTPYITENEGREPRSIRYIRQNRNGIMTDKSLDIEQINESEQFRKLTQFINMEHFMPLLDGPETIKRNDDTYEIRLGMKDSLTIYQNFFTGVPASVGKEVMLIKQMDGYYYGDAAQFSQLEETLNYLFASVN